MKSVLVIDATPTFKDFLRDKFASERIEVNFVNNKFASIPKIISFFPDLVILDISEYDNSTLLISFLSRVKSDPNASQIPIIAAGPNKDKTEVSLYARYGLLKYFIKPIKFDIFFEAVGQILKTSIAMDITPCVLEIHRKDNLFIIEIAKGLNREKISLLKYKLSEMIESDSIDNPKVLLLMTTVELTFVDGLNLEMLFDNLLACPRIHNRNIKILSMDNFVKELIEGHPQYYGIEVAKDVSTVVKTMSNNNGPNIADLIRDTILTQDNREREDDRGSLELKFSSDENIVQFSEDDKTSSLFQAVNVAIVDDDKHSLINLKKTFEASYIYCDLYTNGTSFMQGIKKQRYSLIIIDIFMPGISGLDILRQIKKEFRKIPPIILYTRPAPRDKVIQAISLGVNKYIVKPQKPEILLKYAIELINKK